MILFGITELWLSFWSEVHYNSLYTSGGDVLITLKWIFLLTYSILSSLSEVLSNNKLIFYSFNEFADVPSRVPKKKYWLF